jgi:hypothetical protein
MIHRVAGLAQDSGKLSLQLLGRERIAAFPDLYLLSHQMIHADTHSTDNANGHSVSIRFFQGTKIAFHDLLKNL